MKKLLVADTPELKKQLLNFYKAQYKDHPLRRDSMSDLLKGMLYKTSELSKSATVLPIIIKQGESIVLTALLAHAERLAQYAQIAFLESPVYDKAAFDLLMYQAEAFAKERGCTRICASLNIHVNYGLGYLQDRYDEPQSFGMAHNPPHLHEYFAAYDFEKIELVTFKKEMQRLKALTAPAVKQRLADRYTLRTVNFSKLTEEAAIYTRINNEAFADHPFYYERIPAEDLELFKDFQYLLKPENLIFVQKNGIDVGFMLWYPDFHQIMGQRESVGLKTVLKSKLGKKMDTFKIVEIGVIPKEQGRGAILALFEYCRSFTEGKFDYFESGWVVKDNLKSKSLGDKWADGISKTYAAYEKALEVR